MEPRSPSARQDTEAIVVQGSCSQTDADLRSLTAACFLAFLLSLGGIPFTLGFWGKTYVFLVAGEAGMWGLVLLGALLVLGGGLVPGWFVEAALAVVPSIG